jgi:ADP-ribose pyrophosphatase YjhB (NUDIX family)
MQNTNIILHQYQKDLLRKLTLTKSLHFNELLLSGLESEHMNYHLKKLVEIGFVIKVNGAYRLTDSGKDYSNLMDDLVTDVEKQPKCSIIIRGVRKNVKTGKIEHLLMKRLRQPYFGKVGRLTGKVHFGETFKQAAERELFEETGLKATSFHLEEIYRKIRKREDGHFVQDVIFYIFLVTGFSGTIVKRTPLQENFWITKKELSKRNDLDPYDDLVLHDTLIPKGLVLEENMGIADGF